MALLPNLSGKLRVGYFVAGVALAAWGLYGADASWARISWLAAGSVLIVFAIVGFCPFMWMFGVRGSSA